MTQKITINISYMIHPSSCDIMYSHVQITERQQFSTVIVSLKLWIFKVFFL